MPTEVGLIEKFIIMLKDNPIVAVAAISMALNVYLFKILLQFNERYINLLTSNANIVKQLNELMGKFKIGTGIVRIKTIPPEGEKSESENEIEEKG